ncbi:MAG: hypothetical protein M5R38_08015 [Candidatus Methylomirabilis sp.]|nr:hypothetical protein [Candidatus Methylomirabilis sp.]
MPCERRWESEKAEPSIYEEFRRTHSRSEALFRRAKTTIAGGLTHDIRHLHPFPIYVDRAGGSRKWDVDGHELIDYWMGHGALILAMAIRLSNRPWLNSLAAAPTTARVMSWRFGGPSRC